MILVAAHAGTARRPDHVLLGSLLLALAGCPETSSPGDSALRLDGGADGGLVLRVCEEAIAAPAEAACDFVGQCNNCAPEGATACVMGRVQHGLPSACLDASVRDAASTDLLDAGPSDAGMCAPGSPTGATACRGDDDCSSARFERCIAPDENPGCGVCFMPPHDCVTDADCAETDVCARTFNPCGVCAGGDGYGEICIPRCDPTSCAPGEACGSDGHCAPISCMAGYECPLGTHCIDRAAGVDAHGCLRQTCTFDGECPCGTGCVDGHCYDTLGVCEPPRA